MPAAALQILYNLPLARMKQRLLAANVGGLFIFLVSAVALCSLACATPPRHDSPAARLAVTSSNVEAPLNINIASASELEQLPGVGKVIAERIITYRRDNGPFRRAEHLMMVQGISESKFRAMRHLIVVE
jgi:competence ComEA-like helix-hairpin-helix protein